LSRCCAPGEIDDEPLSKSVSPGKVTSSRSSWR
jgi:hypothetical protein